MSEIKLNIAAICTVAIMFFVCNFFNFDFNKVLLMYIFIILSKMEYRQND